LLGEQAAREQAETANRAKDRFLATLSHELRTPLTPVLATVSAMLGDVETPEALRPVLDMIRRNVSLEARLIEDLLDISRISRGALHFKRDVVDAHELVDRAIEICRDEFGGARLELAIDLAAARHHIDADPIRFQQVLWNLVKNAIKFTPAGGRVTVCSHNRPGPNPAGDSELVIEVSDTGIGIAADELPRIFNIMNHGGISATRRFGGLGLGLNLSRSIVEQHDGRLTASSAGPGLGATLTIEIPTVFVNARARPDDLLFSPAPEGAPENPRRRIRILLVDDNEDTLNFLSTILLRDGHEVRTASDMSSALRLALGSDFDLLISDIELPDGTGLELMSKIRATRALPGIALSGFGSITDVEHSRAAGFALHLTKPVEFRRLDQAIQQVAAPVPDAGARAR
jgi:CheY-like chemotaxis protein